jgi:hypothetical protein
MPLDAHLILWPAIALAALTFVVSLRMYVVRIGEMRRLRIHPQAVASSAQSAQRFVDTRASDNFRNLFELPVLFYAALGIAFAAGTVDRTLLALAWLFVALRVAHSAIHCSYNRVMHRFSTYAAASVVLWALWGWLAWQLSR